MMHKLWTTTIATFICASVFTQMVAAAPLLSMPIGSEYLDVEYIVGSGENLSIVVIDFQNTGGDSYAFGYRWDVATNFENIVKQIRDNGPPGNSLIASLGSFPPFGAFTNNFEYDGDAGEPDDFWRLEVGTYATSNISWAFSDAGMTWLTSLNFNGTPTFDPGDLPNDIQPSGTTGIVGFYNSFADSSIKPRIPTTAVPEPATLMLATAAGVLWLITARRNRDAAKKACG